MPVRPQQELHLTQQDWKLNLTVCVLDNFDTITESVWMGGDYLLLYCPTTTNITIAVDVLLYHVNTFNVAALLT